MEPGLSSLTLYPAFLTEEMLQAEYDDVTRAAQQTELDELEFKTCFSKATR